LTRTYRDLGDGWRFASPSYGFWGEALSGSFCFFFQKEALGLVLAWKLVWVCAGFREIGWLLDLGFPSRAF
jgi:hypothetical protein